MNRKCKITFKADANLISKMRQSIKKDGYGVRGKSKWISEALDELFANKDYIEMIEADNPIVKLQNNPEVIYIAFQLRERMDSVIKKCNIRNPFAKGMQSAIIRTAIFQRLLESKSFTG